MTKMNNPFIRFLILLSVVLVLVFAGHLLVLQLLNHPLFDNMIIPAYLANYILAIGIFLSLYLLRKKYSSVLGFIFMGGSFVKFIVFFIFFYPVYRADGSPNALETTAFLVPYLTSLFIETYTLVKLLQREP
jgi:Fe2+ transport system protein B